MTRTRANMTALELVTEIIRQGLTQGLEFPQGVGARDKDSIEISVRCLLRDLDERYERLTSTESAREQKGDSRLAA